METVLVTSYLNLLSDFLISQNLSKEASVVSSLEAEYSLNKSAIGARPKGGDTPPEETSSEASSEPNKDPAPTNNSASSSEFSSVKRNSSDKGSVRKLQTALVDAGFPLPRFGVDGKFGEETESALIKFKRKAKSDGKYTGDIDGDASEGVYNLIVSYSKSAPAAVNVNNQSEPEPRSSGESIGILYLGDSQMAGALGNALIAQLGRGVRLAKKSTRASHWANHPRLIETLERNPSKVIVSLNGNGIGGTEELIKTLRDNLPEGTPLVWSGAPPPQYRGGDEKTWAKYLTTPSGFDRAYNRRIKNNNTVASLVNSVKNWTFVSPFDHIKYETPIKVGGKEYVSGYVCPPCDGVHLPNAVSEAYVSKIAGLL